jgi:class 3 adenylate cyclase
MRYHRMLISEEVYNRLNADVRAREYGSVELKGKSATLRVFQLELL